MAVRGGLRGEGGDKLKLNAHVSVMINKIIKEKMLRIFSLSETRRRRRTTTTTRSFVGADGTSGSPGTGNKSRPVTEKSVCVCVCVCVCVYARAYVCVYNRHRPPPPLCFK